MREDRRYTEFPVEGRPDHAICDSRYVINCKNPPFECIKCKTPCSHETFYYEHAENIDCASHYNGRAAECPVSFLGEHSWSNTGECIEGNMRFITRKCGTCGQTEKLKEEQIEETL